MLRGARGAAFIGSVDGLACGMFVDTPEVVTTVVESVPGKDFSFEFKFVANVEPPSPFALSGWFGMVIVLVVVDILGSSSPNSVSKSKCEDVDRCVLQKDNFSQLISKTILLKY